MYNCSKHLDREALSFCHNCGKFFCRECLTEGKEYYYCSAPECRAILIREKEEEIVSPENCGNIVHENDYTKIDFNFNKMDAGVFASLLDNADIDYYSTMNYFPEMPVEFYIRNDRFIEAGEIASRMNLNALPFSTKNDLE